jgi:uncharacterized repeat protein (TIGR01451 family)
MSLLLCLGLAVVPLWFLSQSPVTPEDDALLTQLEDQPAHATDRLIIQLAYAPDDPLSPQNTGDDSLDRLMDRFDVQETEPLFGVGAGGAGSSLKRQMGLDQIYVLTLPPDTNLQSAVGAFSADRGVVYAELDHVGWGIGMPDDVRFDEQWGLHNVGQEGGAPDADIDAPEAWEVTTGAPTTILAIIDTGVDLNHPDLAGELVSGYDFVNWDPTPQDDHGHGTHVSGIAAAATDNDLGVAGVCPACRVMPLKALNSSNWGYYSWWAQAIEYAVDNGADVINMSMGGTSASQTLYNAVVYATNAGVPVVAAMMNDGDDTAYYPALYAETIAVGSTDRFDVRSDFSCFGDHIDLVAPGSSILSTLWDDAYAPWSGTSMATPHVVGTLGLVRTLQPDDSIEALRRILRSTADDQVGPPGEDIPGWDEYFGAGRLNADRAVRAVVPLTGVSLTGPESGFILAEQTFTAVAGPITATRVYTWEATGHPPVVRSGDLTDMVTFSWDTTGPKTVTVTAANFATVLSATHVVDVAIPPPDATLTVCQSGDCGYRDIQTAVDAASAGNVIQVAAGTYTGTNDYGGLSQVVYVDRQVTLRGGYGPDFTGAPDPEAHPTIVDAQGAGRVFCVTGAISPTIEGFHVTGGDAAGLGGGLGGGDVGGGVYVIDANATLSGCHIVSNTARYGGGVYFWDSDGTIVGNTITGNTADWGAGIYLDSESAAMVVDNQVMGNAAQNDGGGIYLYHSPAALRGNRVEDNQAVLLAGGLYMWESDAALSENQFTGNVAGSDGGGIYVARCDAVFTNTLVAGNGAAGAGGGIFMRNSSLDLLHTTLAQNLGSDGMAVANNSAARLTNTILVSHSVGIAVAVDNVARLEATLWGNDVDWTGGGTISVGMENVTGDPAFVDPAAGEYHITADSAARDAGVDAGVTRDVDGELRPFGLAVDLGADELHVPPTPALAVIASATPNPVAAGAALTYTLRVTNTGGVALTVTITDTLPDGVVPGGARFWSPVVIEPGEFWVEDVVVTVDPDASGSLANRLEVTTLEGASGEETCIVFAREAVVTVGPAAGATLVGTAPDGLTTTVVIPPGAVAQETQVGYTTLTTVTGLPAGYGFAGRSFILDGFRGGDPLAELVFDEPVTATVRYDPEDLGGYPADGLVIYSWDGGAWTLDGVSGLEQDSMQRWLRVELGHGGQFAAFVRQQRQIFLPLALRTSSG